MINGLWLLVFTYPPTVGNSTAYSLRSASDYKYLRSNTQLYYNSFLPSVVRDWNELPNTTRNAPSISAFKRSLNSTLIGVSLFYLDGKRIGQIYHSRLRMDFSSLNHHLFSKKRHVRFAFVVDQKLPNTTCLNVIDFITWARKWCNQYLNYANQPWILFYTESQICLTRQIGSSTSSYRSIYLGLNDSNKLPLSNYSLTLRFTN